MNTFFLREIQAYLFQERLFAKFFLILNPIQLILFPTLVTQSIERLLIIKEPADPPGVNRAKKKSIMEPPLHFLYGPADLEAYYKYILVHKKGGRGD